MTFIRAEFSGGRMHLGGAEFFSGTVVFGRTQVSGGEADFHGAVFSGGDVAFSDAMGDPSRWTP